MSAKLEFSSTLTPLPNGSLIKTLLYDLWRLRSDLICEVAKHQFIVDELHERQKLCARNMLCYLALRRNDIRSLQERLTRLGLSSLGRLEARVLPNIDSVLSLLHVLAGQPWPNHTPSFPQLCESYIPGKEILAQRTNELFGALPEDQPTHIMVTLPTEAAFCDETIKNLLQAGMTCIRINCAHDDRNIWERMLNKLYEAKEELKKPCKIYMDLGGPKLRTGALPFRPRVISWHPLRDRFGKAVEPVLVSLYAVDGITAIDATTPFATPNAPALPVPARFLKKLEPGMLLKFVDARNARRTLKVSAIVNGSVVCDSWQSCYVSENTTIGIDGKSDVFTTLGPLQLEEEVLLLKPNDLLRLVKPTSSGHTATETEPAAIPCTLSEIFSCVRPGDRIYFDDGKIGGSIENVEPDALLIRIKQARPNGSILRSDKGINLPDSDLPIPSLTEKDRIDLPFIAQHADLVGYSFVSSSCDVRMLREQLDRLNRTDLGVILKIESKRAFKALPEMFLESMRLPKVGVMIARGDLAIECGFERLAEVQEEILWLCEAAYMPVVWATQVLETYAKKGIPTRAEITDAAMSQRAECVMLNKGPHIVEVIQALKDIVRRMQGHHDKKSPLLRRLESWGVSS